MTDLPYWTLHEAPPDSPKKWVVRVPTASGRGKIVPFGARGYEDFTMHKDKTRRDRKGGYRDRHKHDRLDDPYAPGFWSMWALWGESDDLDTAFAAAVRKAKKLLEKNMARKNPVHEQFNFTHYEEYASRLTDDQLHHAIIDALDALKVARTWEDNGAGEAKYLDQLSVLRREQKARGMRSNPTHFEQYEFRVSNSFLPALFNGDTSGLSPEDEAALDRFLAKVMKLGHGHWAEIEEDAGFGRDEITGLGSDRALVAWMVPSARHNPRPLREDWLEQAREAGRNDAINFGSAIAERHDYLAQAGWRELDEADRMALLRAWEQGVGEAQQEHRAARHNGLFDFFRSKPTEAPKPAAKRVYTPEERDAAIAARSTSDVVNNTPLVLTRTEDRVIELDGVPTPARYVFTQEEDLRYEGVEQREETTVEYHGNLYVVSSYRQKAPYAGLNLGGRWSEWYHQFFALLPDGRRQKLTVFGIDRMAHAAAVEMLPKIVKANEGEEDSEVRQNPEWARKVGGAVYRGTRKAAKYAKEVGTDLYHGAREAHRSHRDNPSASVTHRLTGIGRLTITPDPEGARDDASVEVTKAFAAEWDHDMLNHAYLSRDVMAAAEEHREDSNFYAVTLTYQGREFAKLYP